MVDGFNFDMPKDSAECQTLLCRLKADFIKRKHSEKISEDSQYILEYCIFYGVFFISKEEEEKAKEVSPSNIEVSEAHYAAFARAQEIFRELLAIAGYEVANLLFPRSFYMAWVTGYALWHHNQDMTTYSVISDPCKFTEWAEGYKSQVITG